METKTSSVHFCLLRAKSLYETGSIKHAFDLYCEIASQYPEDWRPQIGIVRCMEKISTPLATLNKLKEISPRFPETFQPRWKIAQTLIKLGQTENAIKTLRELTSDWPDYDLPACKLVELKQRDTPDFQEWESVRKKFPESMWAQLGLANSLRDLGYPKEALNHYLEAEQRWPKSLSILKQLARLFISIGEFGLALERIKSNLELRPKSPVARRQFLCCHTKLENYELVRKFAAKYLQEAPDELWLRLFYARAAQGLGFKQSDCFFSEAWLADRPNDTRFIQFHLENLRKSGQFGKIKNVIANTQRLSTGSLSSVLLKDQLNAIMPGGELLTGDLPLLRRIWRTNIYGNMSWESFLKKLAWHRAANKIVNEAINMRSDAAEKLDNLISLSHPKLISSAQNCGSGGLLVGSHQGPTLAAMYYLERHIKPYYTLENRFSLNSLRMSKFATNKHTQHSILTGQRPVMTMRRLLEALKQGAFVGLAADIVKKSSYISAPLFSGVARISTLAPRVAYQYRVPVFWCQPSWKQQKIVIELSKLTSPKDGEELEDFTQRWCKMFAGKLEYHLRSNPGNMDMNHQLWWHECLTPRLACLVKG
ncbi:LpxL/LpxP family acyltransferase [Flexibacterium corallicola]|uniref:LpxL/LpxP family acyltransferase n=1 Tax=Flexibacterium corallicola TaxID=3037259 RepID=UPI00286EB8E4|nr:hypothetical protein [Pseudovibrio sp. M1P-2-3]